MDRHRFDALLQGFSGITVGVVGDFILDEYWIGETRRVSREAPVVVIDFLESRYHPGGAANAAQNVCSLGGAGRAFGVTGDDEYGRKLRTILEASGTDTAGLAASADTMTAVKTRILAGELHAQKQQVSRIDRSRKLDPVAGARALEAQVDAIVTDCGALLMSDYGLGLIPGPLSDRLIAGARERGVPVVVDSRFELPAFTGATVATPNEVELFDALDVVGGELEALVPPLIEKNDMQGLIVTRGSHGMQVFERNGDSAHVGIVGTRDVADVTGAGDTVSAAVALSLAAGATLTEAAEMATYAAAVVVMKRGTATVDRAEMVRVREEYPQPMQGGGA